MNEPTLINHRYRDLAQIGQGDIATVYYARDSQTGKSIAIKLLRTDSPEPNARAFFDNEARLLAEIAHPTIPKFYGMFLTDSGIPCIAMQFIEGQDGETKLAALAEGTFFPPEIVIHWGLQLCDALAYLHTLPEPIIFRDLKPAHMMIAADNRVWLVDFNLAVKLPVGQSTIKTIAAGTEGFAAPEQYDGIASPLCDIYSLGASLHYLLTRIDPRKERPFTFAPPRSVNPTISKTLAAVIAQATAYEPEARFSSIQAMKAALVNCI